MTKDLLQQDRVVASTEVVGGEGVAHQVRVDPLPDAGDLAKGADQLLDGRLGQGVELPAVPTAAEDVIARSLLDPSNTSDIAPTED